MDSTEQGDLERELRAAVEKACEEKVLISGWVVVAEVMDHESGDGGLVTLCDTHTPPWDAYGMLMWAADEFSDSRAGVED